MEAYIVLFMLVIIVCWACYKRKWIKAVYGVVSLELTLQVFSLLSNNIGDNGIAAFLSHFPPGLLFIAADYTNGLIYTVLFWIFVLIMIYFLMLTIRMFFKK